MIDQADKDKKCVKFDKNFSIKVFMNKIDEYEFKAKALKADKHKPKKMKKNDGSDESADESLDEDDNVGGKEKTL